MSRWACHLLVAGLNSSCFKCAFLVTAWYRDIFTKDFSVEFILVHAIRPSRLATKVMEPGLRFVQAA
eukprot:3673475-Pleurochrysis_carterae.AAC.1